MKKISFLLCTLCVFCSLCASPLRLPRFFSDGMVLQRGQKLPVWGWGTPGQTIKVTLCGKTAKTKVQPDGTWRAILPKFKATTTPQQLLIVSDGGENLLVRNVLIGDLYLCSGQSNMELPIRRCMDKQAERVKNYSNPNIRYLKFPHQYNYVRPNDDVQIRPWQDITPENCGEVSAICYFMARQLQEETGVPIGIINSAVGGTKVDAWMPQESLKDFPAYAQEFSKLKYNQQNWPDSIMRSEMRAGNEWERQMMRSDTIVNHWRTPGYDFSRWAATDIFSDWGKAGNGSYWFRHTLVLPADCAGKTATLRLGAMKDADSVFVNGRFVGNTTYEYPPRIYTVPQGLLREGENEVMVHLMSQGGRPNFTPQKLYQLEVGNHIFPIPSQWQMAQGSRMRPKPGSTYFVDCPTGLYNAMIAPLRDLPISGMLWYQGESNAGKKDYADYLVRMVEEWRRQWHSEFPVVICELAGFQTGHNPGLEASWASLREQQRQASERLKKAALVPLSDTGEWNDIHPQDKDIAGQRAAEKMSKLVYGK